MTTFEVNEKWCAGLVRIQRWETTNRHHVLQKHRVIPSREYRLYEERKRFDICEKGLDFCWWWLGHRRKYYLVLTWPGTTLWVLVTKPPALNPKLRNFWNCGWMGETAIPKEFQKKVNVTCTHWIRGRYQCLLSAWLHWNIGRSFIQVT